MVKINYVIKSSRVIGVGHAARMEMRNACRIVGGKSKGRRITLEDNIKMGVRKIGYGDVSCIQLSL
jgi:hypothetical protein